MKKLAVYDAVLTFHAHVLACGYVPVDFYDGSVLYDCALKKTLLCDIEFYKKRPYYNSMGRMWGSSRFMSPEELTMGMPVDERTCVYVMGATAFELFGAGKKNTQAGGLASLPAALPRGGPGCAGGPRGTLADACGVYGRMADGLRGNDNKTD